MNKLLMKVAAGALLAATSLSPAMAAGSADPLAAGFADPPNSARPYVWWHWMNGNVSKDGIRKDMEWMKRVGIGGLQNFDANLATPQIVPKRLIYMHSEWKDAFGYAARTAEELGLELAIAASPGWSETGGPWVKPADGLKKLVWSETLVPGGKRFSGKLAAPPSITGPFQSIKFRESLPGGSEDHADKPVHYGDVAVLAVAVTITAGVDAQVASSGKLLETATITDDDLETSVNVMRGTAQQPTAIALDYPSETTIRSATIFIPGEVSPFTGAAFTPVLEANDNGTWRKLAGIPITAVPTTVSFAPVTARQFRVVLGPSTEPPRIGLGEGAPGSLSLDIFPPPGPDAPVKIAELRLSGDAKVDRYEAKAGFTVARDYYALSADVPDLAGIDPSKVVNLTGRMKPDGTLDWTPPKGNWRVLRLGYSLLGTTNHPAPAEATGLEVDKFDGPAVRNYLETYLGMYRGASGGMIGDKGVRALLTDSIEVGAANWTPRMIEQFKRLRGYDPMPWLPALTGVVIGSHGQSDKFLYDYRRTLGDLMASEHYGTVAAVAHENKLKVYGEALEDIRPSLGDDMTMRKYADIPMAALWTWNRGSVPRPTLIGDMKGASSVAHIYGQNLTAAESMTAFNSPWAFAPADLRRIIDFEFAQGINRPVIHTSVHQPVDDKQPGLSLAIFGQYFNRHESWAEMARPWVDYIARNSFMLQSGRNFADVAYFYGEEAPLTALFAQEPLKDLPTRYAYDFVNPDALLNQLSVENGELVAKGGARYRVLYLGGTSQRMTLTLLRRLAALVEAGATVVGEAPTSSPSLQDNRAEFEALKAKLWSGQPVGSGRVIAGRDVEATLASLGIVPDFEFNKPEQDSEILFVHRRLTDGDVYFVNNRVDRSQSVEARFRVDGKAPEIWNADTGISEPASYSIENGITTVPLEMGAEDSFFVVFRKPAVVPSVSYVKPILTPAIDLSKGWSVAFQGGRGAPATAELKALSPLNDNADAGIKYFSGVASYSRSFDLPAGVRPGDRLWLDLGRIGDVAEVRVNGKPVGTAWHAPYRVDIGDAVRRGSNRLEVRVANLWVNRLIGDAQPGAQKVAFVAAPTYKADAPLRPSGLIGPVTLQVERKR
jgi:hypothetical protein